MYERQAEGGEHGERGARSGMSLRLILVLLLVALAVVFILQNRESQEINFLWMDFSLPEWVLYVIMIAIGILIDRLLQFRSSRHRRAVSD